MGQVPEMVIPHIPIEKRIWISNPRLRRTLKQYTKDGLSPQEFNIFVEDLDPGAFQEYISNSYATCTNANTIIYRPNNPNISSILKYLSSLEPISGMFQFSILNGEELGFVVDLAAESFHLISPSKNMTTSELFDILYIQTSS